MYSTLAVGTIFFYFSICTSVVQYRILTSQKDNEEEKKDLIKNAITARGVRGQRWGRREITEKYIQARKNFNVELILGYSTSSIGILTITIFWKKCPKAI